MAGLAHVVTGPDGVFESWSESLPRLIGVDGAGMPRTTRDWIRCLDPADADGFRAKAIEAAVSGRRVDVEYRFHRADGKWIYLRQVIEPIVDDRGATDGGRWFSTIQDVTEAHDAAARLSASETEYRLLFENNPQAMWVYDTATLRFLAVNRTAVAQYGYSEQEFLAMTIADLRPGEDLPALRQSVATTPQGKKDFGVWRHYRKDRTLIDVEISSDSIMFKGGAARLVMAHNVTARLQGERELARLNRALRMLSACNEALIRAPDEAKLLKDICDTAVGLGGYRVAWVGFARDDVRRSIERVAYAGELTDRLLEVRFSWSAEDPAGNGPSGITIRSGRPFVCEDFRSDAAMPEWAKTLALGHGLAGVICLPLRDARRTFGVICLYMDEVRAVTTDELTLLQELADDLAFGIGHVRAAAAQRRIQTAVLKVAAGVSANTGAAFFERLARNMAEATEADAAFVVRLLPTEPPSGGWLAAVVDGDIVPGQEFVIAGTPAEYILANRECVVLDRLVERFPNSIKAAIGATVCVGQRLDSSWGEPLGLLYLAYRDSPAEPEFICSTLQIFTARAAAELERQQTEAARLSLEDQLRESQKMEAIGTLAGGIAHDFNNILGAILGNAELARQDSGANASILESLEEIRKAGHRAKDLIKQILSFSRRDPPLRSVIMLAPVVEESGRFLRTSLPPRVSIAFSFAPDTPAVLADPTHVGQVVLNLGTNAAHAMQGRSGLISIAVDGVTIDEVAARAHADLHPGRYARITVGDTGEGMDAATLQRVFEPFFTTKPVGTGTGLGLSVVHGIMSAHNGAILVRSEPGKGSTFELYFPATEASVENGTVSSPPAAGVGRGQRILYIDDDQALLYLFKRLLERRGYEVTCFADAAEAIEAVRLDPERFNLVITDYNMPKMSGIDVARQIRALRADMAIAVASGYINEELRTEAVTAGITELIFKPDAVVEFCDVVQRLLLKAQ